MTTVRLRPPVTTDLASEENWGYVYAIEKQALIFYTVYTFSGRRKFIKLRNIQLYIYKVNEFVMSNTPPPPKIDQAVRVLPGAYGVCLLIKCWDSVYRFLNVTSGRVVGTIHIPREDMCFTAKVHYPPLIFGQNIMLICQDARGKKQATLYEYDTAESGHIYLRGGVKFPFAHTHFAQLTQGGHFVFACSFIGAGSNQPDIGLGLCLSLKNMSGRECLSWKVRWPRGTRDAYHWTPKQQILVVYFPNSKVVDISIFHFECFLRNGVSSEPYVVTRTDFNERYSSITGGLVFTVDGGLLVLREAETFERKGKRTRGISRIDIFKPDTFYI